MYIFDFEFPMILSTCPVETRFVSYVNVTIDVFDMIENDLAVETTEIIDLHIFLSFFCDELYYFKMFPSCL